MSFRSLRKVFPVLSVFLLFTCCRQSQPVSSVTGQSIAEPAAISIISPRPNSIFKWGEDIPIRLQISADDIAIDSVRLSSGKSAYKTLSSDYASIKWNTSENRTGKNTLKVVFYLNSGKIESHSIAFTLLSDIQPITYTYQVVNRFPHDVDAYTQGLFYNEDKLYESTGLEGKSTLRIVDIESGEPIRLTSLKPDIFGEGIALFGDKVYMITWRSKIGYVYHAGTLELIRSFTYPIDEGWGLTTDGRNLIMSDGSAQLYFMEPDFFTQVDQMEVFDNKGMVSNLNELEYINGKILANIYGESYIVIIDAATGKVTGKLGLDDLMPPGTRGDLGKVLNGIAYNPKTGHLYITGKDWAVLYEISVTPPL